MSERRALIGVGLAHVALVAAFSLGWASIAEPTPAAPDAIAVDFVEIAETPKRVETRAPAAPLEPDTPAPPPPPAAEPAANDLEPVPEPAPAEPEPEPVVETATEPAPPPVARPRRPRPQPPVEVAEPRPRTPARRPREEESDLASLLDETIGRAPAPRPPRRRPAPEPVEPFDDAPTGPERAELDANAMATLVQAIRGQIVPCWNPPQGLARPSTVTLRIQLAPDGRVDGRPEITAISGERDRDARRAFDESAKRAVLQCAPLRLPADLYEAWRDIELNFDPKDLR